MYCDKGIRRRLSDPLRLLKYGYQVNSQNLEDGMIDEIFHRISTTNRTFVEIGAGNGTENNTAWLASQGWTGYWIDSSSDFNKTIQRSNTVATHIKSRVTYVNKDNVNDILQELRCERDFDLLSLDVDQNTYYVWSGLTRYIPRVIVIEYNPIIPPHIDWKARYDPNKAWDGTANYGASLKALEVLGREKGYSLVGCDIVVVNAFFVRSDLVSSELFCQPFTSENHYEPPRYPAAGMRLFHPRSLMDAVDRSPTQD